MAQDGKVGNTKPKNRKSVQKEQRKSFNSQGGNDEYDSGLGNSDDEEISKKERYQECRAAVEKLNEGIQQNLVSAKKIYNLDLPEDAVASEVAKALKEKHNELSSYSNIKDSKLKLLDELSKLFERSGDKLHGLLEESMLLAEEVDVDAVNSLSGQIAKLDSPTKFREHAQALEKRYLETLTLIDTVESDMRTFSEEVFDSLDKLSKSHETLYPGSQPAIQAGVVTEESLTKLLYVKMKQRDLTNA